MPGFGGGRRLDTERALAFAMGLHGRLSRASPARRFDNALARHVLQEVLQDLAAAAAPRHVELCAGADLRADPLAGRLAGRPGGRPAGQPPRYSSRLGLAQYAMQSSALSAL